jgi:hypothetical protein
MMTTTSPAPTTQTSVGLLKAGAQQTFAEAIVDVGGPT